MTTNSNGSTTALVYLFCGQVPQNKEIYIELYNNNKVFKESMDKIDNYLSINYFNGESMLAKLRQLDINDHSNSNQFLVHSVLFMFHASMFEVLKSEGINPTIIHGASCGEIGSSYCSGMIDLETACTILYQRALFTTKVIQLYPHGKMGKVDISEDEFKSKFLTKYPAVEYTGSYSPFATMFASLDVDQFELLLKDFKDQGIAYIRFPVATAFHSSAMECIKDDVLKLTNIKPIGVPTVPTYSSINGEPFNQQYLFDQNYLYENLRYPVKTGTSFKNIFKDLEEQGVWKKIIFLEITPISYLSAHVFENVKHVINSTVFTSTSNNDINNNVMVLSTLQKGVNDVTHLEETIQIIKNKFDNK